MKRLLALVLTMGIAFSLLAGCTQNANNGDENGGNTGNKEWKIGLIAAGTFGDNGLNDALKKAAETFTENTGIPVTCVEVNEFNDHEIHARNFGNEGYDMVIMGGTVSEIMSPILEDYPDTHFVLNKGTVDGYDNCTSIQFEEPAAGFIGGAFAVMMSEYLGLAASGLPTWSYAATALRRVLPTPVVRLLRPMWVTSPISPRPRSWLCRCTMAA